MKEATRYGRLKILQLSATLGASATGTDSETVNTGYGLLVQKVGCRGTGVFSFNIHDDAEGDDLFNEEVWSDGLVSSSGGALELKVWHYLPPKTALNAAFTDRSAAGNTAVVLLIGERIDKDSEREREILAEVKRARS